MGQFSIIHGLWERSAGSNCGAKKNPAFALDVTKVIIETKKNCFYNQSEPKFWKGSLPKLSNFSALKQTIGFFYCINSKPENRMLHKAEKQSLLQHMSIELLFQCYI